MRAKLVAGVLGFVVLSAGMLAMAGGNRVFARKLLTDQIVNTNVVTSAALTVSDLFPQGNFAARVHMAGGGGGTGTGTVDYVKIQVSVDAANWHDAVTIVNDQAIAATNTVASVYTNLTGILPIAPYYRFSTLVKDTATTGTGTGVVVNAWLVVN